MVKVKWYNQLEVKPEDVLVRHVNPDYDKPEDGYRENEDGRWEHFHVPKSDLHYLTDYVVVFHCGRLELDRKRKFDSSDKWIWTRWEGSEEEPDLLWCPIPPIKKTEK